MKLLIGLVSFLAISATSTLAATNLTDYAGNIFFMTWNAQGAQMNSTFDNGAAFTAMCPNSSNWTMITHAWAESFKGEKWAQSIVDSFVKFRGGCVMFMDYSVYSGLGYSAMVNHINGIVTNMINKFKQLETLGFDPAKGHLFGNGFGSQLFFYSAYNYSPCTIGRIDSCDPAKPQFLNGSVPVQKAKYAAKNVVCYHTSNAYGTDLRYCQKNINLGRCGIYQPASVPTPYTNHELCPYFYNNTFTVDFDIVPKSTVETYYKTRCFNKSVTPSLMPNEAIHVGPRMKTCIPNGEYFVLTGSTYPYNIPSNYTT